MDPLDVTVISCLYGSSHDDYYSDWLASVKALDPAPREVIVATDRYRHLTDGVLEIFKRRQGWRYPQAFYLNAALEYVESDWIWILDIDDIAFPDALADIEQNAAQVIQMGFLRSDGEIHLPKWNGPINQYVAGSIISTMAIRSIGGFRDVEHQDSDLWERLRANGWWFTGADRPRFHYRRHAQARTIREANALAV